VGLSITGSSKRSRPAGNFCSHPPAGFAGHPSALASPLPLHTLLIIVRVADVAVSFRYGSAFSRWVVYAPGTWADY